MSGTTINANASTQKTASQSIKTAKKAGTPKPANAITVRLKSAEREGNGRLISASVAAKKRGFAINRVKNSIGKHADVKLGRSVDGSGRGNVERRRVCGIMVIVRVRWGSVRNEKRSRWR
jgi:hypothetical protein